MSVFDAENKYNLDPKFLCPVCSLILRDPVQLNTCGHRQCQLCFGTDATSTVTCLTCRIEVPRTEVLLDGDFNNGMQSLAINCSFCQWSGALKNYQDHLDRSHPHPQCEYCDKQCNSVNQLNQHKALECEKLIISCELKGFGCSEPIERGNMQEHYLTQQHQDTIIKIVRQMRSQLPDSSTDTTSSRTTTTTAISDPATAQVVDLCETINILTGGIEALDDDEQGLNDELVQNHIDLQTLLETLSKLQTSVEESRSFLQDKESLLNILNQDLTSLQEKIHDMQYVSYDGTFIWKINNLQEKMADAQSERQTRIYSPPFYSSPDGYKMRALLCLNGDGKAHGTHMSLFFVLMRSNFDEILQFPFNYKITFCLYDQTSTNRHFIDSFGPNIRSNSFDRPQLEMNSPIGIPKFFPLTTIQRSGNPYVRDDTMFIKVVVDFGNLLKTSLHHALSLNPGIPINIQHGIIQKAAEQQTRQNS